jgi:hypothetical protein
MQNQYYWALEDDYISHHGILGQKWGVRRYQNPDGSLTEEGKRKIYGLDKNKYGIEDPYNRYKRARKTVKISKAVEDNQKKLDKVKSKGNSEKAAKLAEKQKDLENIHKIMSKDLTKVELDYADKRMKSEVATLIGAVIGGPIGAIAIGSIDWAARGGFKTGQEYNELSKKQWNDITEELLQRKKEGKL